MSTCRLLTDRPARQPQALESSVSFPLKNSHLSRTAESRIFRPNRQEANTITKSLTYAACPRLKFISRPLKTMIFVPHLARWQSFELDVVLNIWRCHDHRLRTRKFKKYSLKSCKARRILVLNHLDHSRSAVTG